MIHEPTVEGHHLAATGGTRAAGGGWFAKDGAGVGRGRDDQLVRAQCGERRIISRSLRYVAWLIWLEEALDSRSSRTISMLSSLPAKTGCRTMISTRRRSWIQAAWPIDLFYE
jgi:hypothetical protein